MPLLSVAQDKFALIIGNDDYNGGYYDLTTCKNDAIEIKRCFDALGYETTILKDASRKEILDAFDTFEKQLSKNTAVGVFYYSGHGTMIDDDYCIIPAKDEIKIDSSLKNKCIETNQIISILKKRCKLSFCFFDACREVLYSDDLHKGNEWNHSTKVDGGSENQQILCFATGYGDVARPGKEKLSPFTKVLASHLFDKESFMKIWNEKIIIEVQAIVNGQKPVIENGLYGEKAHFCFNEKGVKNIYDNTSSNQERISITLNVYPNAKIKFGDNLYDSGTNLSFKVGSTYTYTIEKDGYEPYYGIIKAEPTMANLIDIYLTKAQPAKLLVTSKNPKKVKVYLDNVYKGVTPLTINTTSGKHKIEFTANNYYSHSTTIELTPGNNGTHTTSLYRDIPEWFDFDLYEGGAQHINYHFSPHYQIGLSYMYRPEYTRFSFGAMISTSTGYYTCNNLIDIDWYYIPGDDIKTSTTVDIGNGEIISVTKEKTTTYSNDKDIKYSPEIDPYGLAKQYDANTLILGNVGYNACKGIMLEAGIGCAYHQKRYYMSDTYKITTTTITNNQTGELIGEPTYKYESLGMDHWYRDSSKYSLALRLGAKFFIPLDYYWDNAITLGGGYTYLPMNHEYSSWDVTAGFCWYF